jgi:hypothetical protein
MMAESGARILMSLVKRGGWVENGIEVKRA